MKIKIYILVLCLLPFTMGKSQDADSINERTGNLTACQQIDSIKTQIFENKDREPLKNIKLVDKGIALSEACDDKLILGDLYNIKANLFLDVGNVNQASENYKKAFEIFNKENDPIGLSNCYINFGLIVSSPKKKVEYYKKAIIQSEKAGGKINIANALNNIGVTYEEINKLEKAEEYYKKAYNEFVSLDYQLGIAASLSNFGEIEMLKGNYLEAIEYFKKSNHIFSQESDQKGVSFTYHKIGLLYLKLNNYSSSKFYLDLCDSILNKNALNTFKLELLKTYSDLYHNNGEDLNAYLYTNKYITLKDSLNKISNYNRIETFEYEVEKIKADQQINKLKQQERIDKIKRYSLIVTLILVFIIAGLITSKQRSKIKREKIISSQNKEINRLEKEKLKRELEYKSRELSDFAIHIVQKNDFFDEIKKQIKDIRKQKPEKKIAEKLNEVTLTLNKNINISQSREELELNIDKIHKDFFYNLKQKYPDLTSQELRLLGMLSLNLSSKEIATILNINTASVNTKRYRLRKKLNLDAEITFDQFFQS